MSLAVLAVCRICRRRIVPEGEPLYPGVVRHGGRGLCGLHARLSDNEVERVELARLYRREPSRWMKRAACAPAHVDPEIFHPMDHDGETRMRARKVCARCPVKSDCLEDALDTKDAFGIRGGLTAPERARLAKQRRQEAQ